MKWIKTDRRLRDWTGIKRILAPVIRFLTLALALIPTAGCSPPDTVEPYYFLMIPQLRGGMSRPTAPGNLQGHYYPLVEGGSVYLSWDSSYDADLNTTLLIYRIYLYLDGPPQNFYGEQNLFDLTSVNSYSFQMDPFTGNLYFVVTADDGLAESLPSNTAIVNVYNR